MLERAERFIVTAGDGEMLAEATLTGRPVALFDLPRWYDDIPVVKPLVGGLLSLLGGETYRGTPLQQHIPGRFIDWLTTRGLRLPAAGPGRAAPRAGGAGPGGAAGGRDAGGGAPAARRSAAGGRTGARPAHRGRPACLSPTRPPRACAAPPRRRRMSPAGRGSASPICRTCIWARCRASRLGR